MAGFCTIHEVWGPNYQKGGWAVYEWNIYSNNMRLIAKSPRQYNNPSHAREAAKRFVKMFRNIDMRSGIVRKKK